MGKGDCGEFQLQLFQSWQLLRGKDVVHVAARQQRLITVLAIARESLARCAYDLASEAAEAALELEPLYERAVGLLMQAEGQQGNNASALQAFERYKVQLHLEMGIAPSEGIRKLAESVRCRR